MNLDTNRNLIAAALAAAGGGDRNALQTVYRLTATKLFAVCLRILGERSEAEDVLQEVYMTVWRKSAVFDPALSSPMTWLIAIARNRAIDHLRARAEPAHGAARGGGRARRRQADRRRGPARRAGAGTAATLPQRPCQPRARGIARRVLRRQHLRRACRTHESALRDNEELDPAGDDQIEGLSG